ncbi:unnamed protein product [Phytophthora fragariaefolia]|uniref:Unnamed protein product n=1 Tax=Phytophthora fragariaefolia TaxID=1490495 RepID=A0A9W7D9R7_9STRA|nr:unnamed protein product [Phytophthora fragariaefolia]
MWGFQNQGWSQNWLALKSVKMIIALILQSSCTLNALFDPSSASDTELSQSAVPRAFGMTPSNISTEALHFEAAVNLQLLSEASGLASAAELDDEDEEEKEKATRLRPRTVVKYDVNFVPEDEDGEDYESFGSSESDEGDFGDEEDEPERGEGDDDEDVLTEGDAEQMDEAFIASLKIGNTRLTKAELKERQAALRATVWTTTSSQFEVGGSAW